MFMDINTNTIIAMDMGMDTIITMGMDMDMEVKMITIILKKVHLKR